VTVALTPRRLANRLDPRPPRNAVQLIAAGEGTDGRRTYVDLDFARTAFRSWDLYRNILVVPAAPDYWPPAHRELLLTLDDVLLAQEFTNDGRGANVIRR
jgi:hypothetical protein